MTQVNTINAASAGTTPDIDFDTTKAKESLAAIISAMTNKDVKVENLGNQKISEALLYAALVHKRLSEIEPDSAQRLVNNIRACTRQNIKDNNNQPLYQAVNDIMQRMVNRGRISKAQFKNIRSEALGRAQLDAKSDHIRYRKVAIVDAKSEKGNIDAVLEKAASNTAATKEEVRGMTKQIENRPTLTDAQAKTRWKLLTRFKPEDATAAVGTTTETKPTEVDPIDNITPSEAPDKNKTPSGEFDLAYYPKRDDGRLTIALPPYFSEDIHIVRILHPVTKEVLADLTHVGKSEDNRAIWKWDKPASELNIDSIYLDLTYRQGAHYGLEFDANEFFSRTYT